MRVLDELIIYPSGWAARDKEREFQAKGYDGVKIVSYHHELRGLRAKRVTLIRGYNVSRAELERIVREVHCCVLVPDGIFID